jgi:hypothetical protein
MNTSLLTSPRFAVLGSVLSALLVTSSSRGALVSDPNDPRNWQGATVGTFAQLYLGVDNLANRTTVVNNGLLDDGLFNFAGASGATLVPNLWALTPQSTGQSTGASPGDYSYNTPGPALFNASVAGNGIDDMWVQTPATVGDAVWDLGAPSHGAAIFNTIDHGPLPQEAIESTVYLSNSPTGPWTEAVVERVWLEGYVSNTGVQWDGFAYAVGTGTSATFRYASIINGGPGALQHDGDNEINGVLGLNRDFTPSNVPDGGSSLTLLGIGVAAMGFVSRKLRR